MCQASRPPSWPSGSTEMLSCPVCIEPFGSTVIPVSLPCGHIFCEDDIDQVASIGPFRCPTCRKPFNSGQGQQDIRRLFFSYDAKVGCSGVGDFESYAHPHAARVIYDQLRNLEISSSNNEAESALDNARFWAESLEEIGDESMKKALALLFQSLDHASSRMFDSSKLRIQLKKARSEQSPLRCQLEDALLAVNTANEENVRLSSQLQEAAQNLRWTQLNLRHAESTAISHAERLAVLERSSTLGRTFVGNFNAQIDTLNCQEAEIFQGRFLKARARWEHNSHGKSKEDLSVRKGEHILLINKPPESGIWWLGMFNGRVGYVPDKCLDLSLESSTKLPWVPAMKSHNLRCEVAVDLSFEKGSVIKLLIKTLGIWYVGILNGKIGYVPQEKLEILSTASA